MSARAGVPQSSHRTKRLQRNMDWQDHIACRDCDPNLFTTSERAAEALLVCRPCPVKEQCGEQRHGQEGVWAGRAFYPRKPGRPRK